MRTQAGFTLVETIIYIGLLALALTSLMMIYVSGLQTNEIVSEEQAVSDDRRIAELQIRQRLESASTITTPASGTSSQLVFDSPTASESPVTISVVNEQLMMQLGSNPAVAITPSEIRVTSFQVTRLNGSPASVQISIVYASDTSEATITQTSSWTTTLRYE